MADEKDKYNDEEYQFSELDEISPNGGEESDYAAPPSDSPVAKPMNATNVKRNALIVVGIVILLALIYNLYEALSTRKNNLASQPKSMSAPILPQPKPSVNVATAPIAPTVSISPPPMPAPRATENNSSAVENKQITQKLSEFEQGQQEIRTEVNTVNTQIATMSANVGELASKITQLNEIISELKVKEENKEREKELRKVKFKAERSSHALAPKDILTYHINAVIPGRAWLIATNGSTLTVREGTKIAGYGVVTLIDPQQGKVITSSGKIIRFSQQDS